MPSLARLIRTDFWFRQKLPPLLALAYALLLVGVAEPVLAPKNAADFSGRFGTLGFSSAIEEIVPTIDSSVR